MPRKMARSARPAKSVFSKAKALSHLRPTHLMMQNAIIANTESSVPGKLNVAKTEIAATGTTVIPVGTLAAIIVANVVAMGATGTDTIKTVAALAEIKIEIIVEVGITTEGVSRPPRPEVVTATKRGRRRRSLSRTKMSTVLSRQRTKTRRKPVGCG